VPTNQPPLFAGIPAWCRSGRAMSRAACVLSVLFLLATRCGNPIADARVKPHFAAPPDTTVFVKDSLVVCAHPLNRDAGQMNFVWYLDSTRIPRSSNGDSVCRLYFGLRDTGTHRLVAYAAGSNGVWSGPDTTRIGVLLGKPRLRFMIADTGVYFGDTLAIAASAYDTNGRIIGLQWRIDPGDSTLATVGDTLRYAFCRSAGKYRILATAMDNDSILSLPESVTVRVVADPPVISLSGEISTAIHTPLMLHAARRDTFATRVRWLWAKGRHEFSDTTLADSCAIVFGRLETGMQVVYAKAVDYRGQESNIDSMKVFVRLAAPVVSISHDTVVDVGDTITIRARGADANGWVERYVWAFDSLFTDTTTAGTVKHVWTARDTGRENIVRVKAIDNDSIDSAPDTMNVRLRFGTPVFVGKIADTAMRWTDTITVRCRAADTGGKIERYLWSLGGGGWTDSATADSMRITGKGHGLLTVVAGVRDADGRIALDTFVIDCKAVPCSVAVLSPRAGDTLYVPHYGLGSGKARFSFSAQRSDRAGDAFVYTLWLGASASTLSRQYSGTSNSTVVSKLDTGLCWWQVLAVDSHNDSAWTTGTQVCRMQQRVCFVGHSIVAGLLGDAGRGGFRRSLVDTLRAQAGDPHAIGCEGAMVTGMLAPGQDDSCMAANGKRTFDIYDSLSLHPEVNADLWVFMNGVNDGYNRYPGWYYCATSMDIMHSRNPKSEIYVINGLPLPHDTSDALYTVDSTTRQNLVIFNHLLDSSVTQRRQLWRSRGDYGVWLVDANTPLSNPADSTYNQVYFSDFIHPNQLGYEYIARLILAAMRSAGSVFVK
jgi:hypothetical protein